MFNLLKKLFGKKESYTPPVMPAFPDNQDDLMKCLAPYYQAEKPLDFFFEMFIVDVLEQFPDSSLKAFEDFSQEFDFFSSADGNWRKFVKSELHLSDTIEVAIWDLWLKNSEKAQADGWTYHPWHYAQNFSEKYIADDSKVDVWTDETLAEAKALIEEYRKN